MSEREVLSRSLSRRRFLQVGAAGVAAVTLGQVFGLSPQQARAAAVIRAGSSAALRPHADNFTCTLL